ncbi:MAG: glycosyltransferase [Acidobacteria bacterium]|nr:glycosyltransferase [Acidobacteriota bacterium]
MNDTGRTRPRVVGRFLEAGGQRLLIKGVSYGTFAPDASGAQFPVPERVRQDFRLMREAGLNTVRVYTVPEPSLLDCAAEHGLRVMVGVPWAQHLAFLDDQALTRRVRQDVVSAVRALGSHEAALLFALGNEIPASVVRWHGQRRIEVFLRELYDACKQASPDSVLTYVNFPPTEFLDTSCFDVCSFNVYLHREANLRAYLARLQHVAGHKPMLLAEAGADSIREGLDGQARITAMHLRVAFEEGACGAVAFAWTDEWWRGGHDVHDWAFGLVDRARLPKPALEATRQAFADAPFPAEAQRQWPRVSVVVCAYNAADTLDECLASLMAVRYPDYEVILVNDGSRDATGAIGRRYPKVRVIDIPNGGLSAARNVGMHAADGEIVAYTDADVRVDPDWLTYLVQPFLTGDYIGSGGPNVVPPDDDWVAQCVARAPGGPTHVLLDDRVAEHVPGCNMAFRRESLMAVGGFNPVYLRAGDDVDACWRLQAAGGRIGFAPSALVWHHHRSTIKAYWRQQVGYGEGETWLGAFHPEKFLRGQMLWRGHIYSPLPFVRGLSGRRMNTGVWGSAPFPSIYSNESYRLSYLVHAPIWMVASLGLLALGVLGALTGHPLTVRALTLGGLGVLMTAVRCLRFAWDTDLAGLPGIGERTPDTSRWIYRVVIAWMHFIQPLARFKGRMQGRLSPPEVLSPEHVIRRPWKAPWPTRADVRLGVRLCIGRPESRAFWSERWHAPHDILMELVGTLRAVRPAPRVAVDDGWWLDCDCSVAVGRWGWLQMLVLIEQHAEGRTLLRTTQQLRPSASGVLVVLLTLVALVVVTETVAAAYLPSAAVVLGVTLLGGALRAGWQAVRMRAVVDQALGEVCAAAEFTPLPPRQRRRADG